VDTNKPTIAYQKHNSLEQVIWNAYDDDSLHVPSSSSAKEHAVCSGTWQGRIVGGKIGICVNGVEVPEDP